MDFIVGSWGLGLLDFCLLILVRKCYFFDFFLIMCFIYVFLLNYMNVIIVVKKLFMFILKNMFFGFILKSFVSGILSLKIVIVVM